MRIAALAFSLLLFCTSLYSTDVNQYFKSYPSLEKQDNWLTVIELGEKALSSKKISNKKQAAIHADLAKAYFYLGNYATGEIHAREALELASLLKTKTALIRSIYLLSAHKRGIGNTEDPRAFKESQELIHQALDLLDEGIPAKLKGKVYFNAGTSLSDDPEGDLNLAIDYYQKAITCFQEAHDVDSSHRTTIRLSKAFLLKGDIDTSRELAYGIDESRCTKKTLTHLLYLKAQVAIEDAYLDYAKECISKALETADELGLETDRQRLLKLKEEYQL